MLNMSSTNLIDNGVVQVSCIGPRILIGSLKLFLKCSIEAVYLIFADNTTPYVSAADFNQCISMYYESKFILCVSLITLVNKNLLFHNIFNKL